VNRILPLVKSFQSAIDSDSHAFALAELRRGDAAVVVGLMEGAPIDAGRNANESLVARLRDLGFVPGARCEVVARMWLGGDPMVVRIGGSTFALRRAEAAAVRVHLARAEQTVHQALAPQGTSAAAA
jgi:Fe2+ transport system protein FeoA